MAAKTTSGAGSFTDGTKWGGGVAPVTAADTLTINHAMTWAPGPGSSFQIGTGSGVALTFGSAGSLTLTPAGAFTLTLAGSTAGGNVSTREFVVNATNGAVTINIDATGAGAGFAMLVGNGSDSGNTPYNSGGWALNGNATYGITVASLPSDGTKNSHFAGGTNGGRNHIDASYVTFRRIGSSSQAAFSPHLDVRLKTHTWTNVTLDSCGQWTLNGDTNFTSTLVYTNVVSTNTLTNGTSTYPLSFNMGAAGTRTFNGCRFDKTVKFIATRGFGGSGCYFHNGWEGTTGTYHGGTLTNSFVRQTFDSLITAFNVTNSVLYWDNPAGSNPHWIATNVSAAAGTAFLLNDNVVYYNGTDPAGNIYTVAQSNDADVTVNNNLVLPNAAGSNSGALVTSSGAVGAGSAITVNHNTVFCKGQHVLEIGHLQVSVESPQRWVSFKSNLCIGGTTGYKCLNVDNTTLQDIIAPANANYNGSYQIKTTSGVAGFTNEGRGYAAKWSTTPGANDVDGVDPAFVNGSASFATWSASIGGAGTDEAARAAIQANPALAADLMAYLAAAYRPTAAAYNGAAHDGGTIGAFAGASSALYMTGGGEGPAFGFLEA